MEFIRAVYYAVEERDTPDHVRHPSNDWRPVVGHCYYRGVNLADRFAQDRFIELCGIVQIAQDESEYSDFRVVKIQEIASVADVPTVHPSQLRLV